MFDCLDQQLFILARMPAMKELLAGTGRDPTQWSTIATSIFMIGWASGGLAFGVLGDRIGRARTMMLTILLYSLCTGLSAFSVTFWDFATYRFLTGLGVGGEFAVGVALVAEVMPDRARPLALGLLQALSAVGNVSAALIGIGLFGVEWNRWDLFGVPSDFLAVDVSGGGDPCIPGRADPAAIEGAGTLDESRRRNGRP